MKMNIFKVRPEKELRSPRGIESLKTYHRVQGQADHPGDRLQQLPGAIRQHRQLHSEQRVRRHFGDEQQDRHLFGGEQQDRHLFGGEQQDGVNRLNRGLGPSPGRWESGSAGHSDVTGDLPPAEELFVSPLARLTLSTMLGELSNFDSLRDQQSE